MNVHVLSVDGSEWVRLEDYRALEQQLAETRQAWHDCRAEYTELRRELAEARAALAEVDSEFNDDDGFWWTVWKHRHATALKAAR